MKLFFTFVMPFSTHSSLSSSSSSFFCLSWRQKSQNGWIAIKLASKCSFSHTTRQEKFPRSSRSINLSNQLPVQSQNSLPNNNNISCPIAHIVRNHEGIYCATNQLAMKHKNWFKSDVKAKIEIQFETSEIGSQFFSFSCAFFHSTMAINLMNLSEIWKHFSAVWVLVFLSMPVRCMYTQGAYTCCRIETWIGVACEWVNDWMRKWNVRWENFPFRLIVTFLVLFDAFLHCRIVYIMSGSMRSLFF